MASFTEKMRYLPHLTALTLVAITFVLLSRPRVIRGGADRPVEFDLPEQIGPYRGERLLFCQNDQCLAQYRERDLTGALVCGRCGTGLEQISPGEQLLLPSDTPIIRRVYEVPGQPFVNITVVFSGAERRSIHRPQVCLAAQGHAIRDETLLRVPVEGRAAPLHVSLLDLVRTATLPDGRQVQSFGAYAYWFFNPERETPYHFTRLVRMAYDNIFRNYRPRWAYVIVATQNTTNDDGHIERIRTFINLLEPIIERERTAMAAEL